MKCPECQAENIDSRRFCRESGAKLSLICHACGEQNLPGDKFCGQCGADLRQPNAPTPIDYSNPRSYTPKYLLDKIFVNRKAGITTGRKIIRTVPFQHFGKSMHWGIRPLPSRISVVSKETGGEYKTRKIISRKPLYSSVKLTTFPGRTGFAPNLTGCQTIRTVFDFYQLSCHHADNFIFIL